MMKDSLNVCVHGVGWAGTRYIKAFMNNPCSSVVAISDRSLTICESKAKEVGLRDVRFYTDFSKLLEDKDVDIVAICTPQFLHAREAIQVAEAGKHMVIEKPVATKLEDLKAMRDAVSKAQVKTVVGFVLRWNPLLETIKAMISDNFIGDIYYVETDYQWNLADWWSGWEWAKKKELGVSSFLVGGIHAIDAARWFASKDRHKAANIIEVTSYAGGYRIRRDVEYPGLEVMLVKFDNGALGKISSNFDCVMPYRFPMSIFGDKGTIKDNRLWSPHKIPGQKSWVEIPTIHPHDEHATYEPFQREVDHFVDCILNNKDSHCDLESAVNTHEVAIAAIISSDENRSVRIPLASS